MSRVWMDAPPLHGRVVSLSRVFEGGLDHERLSFFSFSVHDNSSHAKV